MTVRSAMVPLVVLGVLGASPTVRAEDDVPGSKDHPLLTRMPGYYISDYKVEEFAAFDPTVIDGPALHWEGKKTTLAYYVKEGAKQFSPLQIVRNYAGAMRKAGAKLPGGDERRMTAELRKGGAMTGAYLEVYNEGRNYELTVVESGEMRQDVVADAAAMGRDLEGAGKIVLQGITFDTGSAVIKPESQATLAEMVKLLKGTPALKAAIVGHTDDVGSADANLKLSASRADALVKALVAKGVASGRLKAFGAGPYCPVASNRDEKGRAQNRRVELVKQ